MSDLRTNEKRYRNLFERGLVGKAVVTPDELFSEVNQSYCDLLGYNRDELIGTHTSVVVLEDERLESVQRLRAVLNDEMPAYKTERKYQHKDGHVVTVLLDVTPERDEAGRVEALVIQAQDITELKAKEAGLRENERRLRDFAEIAADWFWETDEDLVVTYISDAHRDITGIPDDWIIGHTRDALFRENIYRGVNPDVHLCTLENRWQSVIEYSVRRSDGQEVVVQDRASPFFDPAGAFMGYRGVGRDITEQKRLSERIAYQATRDPLSGVVNRREFERCLGEAISEAHQLGARHVLCFADLNRFKLLNDTLGHAAGDYSLKTVVDKIRDNISSTDLLGRIGGDEFGILFRHTEPRDVEPIALQIARTIEGHRFQWQERTFDVTISLGLIPIDKHVESGPELMARADSVCYRAKQSGRGVWVADETEATRLKTYSEILGALSDGPVDLSSHVRLTAQPICSLSNPESATAWYEVLLRLVGEDGCLYRPYDFIRLAEQRGKMPLVDQWVLEQAAPAHATLVKRVPNALMSINVAATSLNNRRFEDLIQGAIRGTGIEPHNLCFEIGESKAWSDLEQTVEMAGLLSSRGFGVALDGFGNGPSSFECLKNLPVRYLKLYGDFARKLDRHGPDIAIIESMRDLSRRLGLSLVAVQVETQDVADTLKDIGVEFGQGDALAAVQPLEEVVQELAQQR